MVMSMGARQECIDAVRVRYLNGNRTIKGQILTELKELTGLHRKHLVRQLNRVLRRMATEVRIPPKKRRGCKARYKNDAEFCQHLKRLWFLTDQLCAPNFKAAIRHWLPAYKEENAVAVAVEEKLLMVSAATVGRILEPYKYRTKRRSGTKPGSLLRTEIPIRTDFWDVTGPGFMEADTVAHCGGSMSGEFAWTLTATDIETTWTEIRCVWHKLAENVKNAVIDIENYLPFPILAFDSDNGGEFINHALVHYFSGKFIAFTRSREYRKNDNAHVEQKNYTHARHLLGYERIDSKAVVPLINDLMRNEVSLLRNHFVPCLKLAEKMRIKSRLIRKYPAPVTPYERILASPAIPEYKKEELRAKHATLNPLKLSRTIDEKLRRIFRILRDEHNELKAG